MEHRDTPRLRAQRTPAFRRGHDEPDFVRPIMADSPAMRELELERWARAVIASTASQAGWLCAALTTADFEDPVRVDLLAIQVRAMRGDLAELEARLLTAADGLRRGGRP